MLVFQLSGVQPLVSNSRRLLELSRRVVGDSITDWLLQQTFFGHFCAGTSSETIRPVIIRLQKNGVGSILDYAAEADVAQPRKLEVSRDQLQARTYDYQGEDECDANTDVTLHAIRTAAELRQLTGAPGFAAVKVTAIGKPELLQHVSQVLGENKSLFLQLFASSAAAATATSTSGAAGADSDPRAGRLGPEGQGTSDPVADEPSDSVVLQRPPHPGEWDLVLGAAARIAKGTLASASVTLPTFLAAVKSAGLPLSAVEAEAIFRAIDSDGSDSIGYIEWVDYMTLLRLGQQHATHAATSKILVPGSEPHLNADLLRRLEAMERRARRIAAAAAEQVRASVEPDRGLERYLDWVGLG